MITTIYGTQGGVCFHPMDEDGCAMEVPIIITKDAGGTTILHQRDQTLNVPEDFVPEFIKALQKHLKKAGT